jgi:hypothetical protein
MAAPCSVDDEVDRTALLAVEEPGDGGIINASILLAAGRAEHKSSLSSDFN